MAFRLMLASAAALALGAAILHAQPEPDYERVTSRAEALAERTPLTHSVAGPSACVPVVVPAVRVPAEI